MTKTKKKIFIIAPPIRKRESLITMISAMQNNPEIVVCDSWEQVLEMKIKLPPQLIFIDERIHKALNIPETLKIRQFFPSGQIVLLKSHPSSGNQTSESDVHELIYDNVSLETIIQLQI